MMQAKLVDGKAYVKHQEGRVYLELDDGTEEGGGWALMTPGAARAIADLLTTAAKKADNFNARSTRKV